LKPSYAYTYLCNSKLFGGVDDDPNLIYKI